MNNLSRAAGETPTRVEYWQVEDDAAGQRLDNFLLSRLRGVPRTRIYRLLRKGEVRVNKKRSAPSYRLQAGDVVRVPPIRRPQSPVDQGAPPAVAEELLGRVLFEDDRLLVVDKPSGMAVHGGSGLSFGVIEALRAARTDDHYLELVHRLDRETSGCLLVARRRSYLRALHGLLRSGAIEKRYLALVRGQWHLGETTLQDKVRTHTRRGGERHVTVSEDGKQAISRFSPVQIFSHTSLVEVRLLTGRTHQIRVQAAAAGHPLAGDDRYGDPAFNRQMKRTGLRRMFLHASSLSFEDPVNGEYRSFSAPLPEDLRAVLDVLEPAAAGPGRGRRGR